MTPRIRIEDRQQSSIVSRLRAPVEAHDDRLTRLLTGRDQVQAAELLHDCAGAIRALLTHRIGAATLALDVLARIEGDIALPTGPAPGQPRPEAHPFVARSVAPSVPEAALVDAPNPAPGRPRLRLLRALTGEASP